LRLQQSLNYINQSTLSIKQYKSAKIPEGELWPFPLNEVNQSIASYLMQQEIA